MFKILFSEAFLTVMKVFLWYNFKETSLNATFPS